MQSLLQGIKLAIWLASWLANNTHIGFDAGVRLGAVIILINPSIPCINEWEAVELSSVQFSSAQFGFAFVSYFVESSTDFLLSFHVG